MEKESKINKSLEKELSLKEKFQILLKLFGNDTARKNFIALCKAYNTERISDTVIGGDAENYRPHARMNYSPKKRANLHNQIMETISKLSTQSKKLTEEQQKVLVDFGSREAVANAIGEYVIAERGGGGGETEFKSTQKSMSDTAFFHSLGREH